jgi:iron complex outermembrane receptor protein
MQTTSPALGGASLRILGLSGRYSQILSDGLPLYGAQSGSVGILQIPPMDLGQVEVIKGVASALYGMSAIGGVVNLVSRRPKVAEHQLLVNRTSHRGTDTALWYAQPVSPQWSYSVLAGAHWQQRSDLNGDRWSDLPMFRRVQVRPRVSWDNGAGRSLFVTVGAVDEDRRGGAAFHPENLMTRQFDGGVVGRFLIAGGRVVSLRASTVSQWHDHTIGAGLERERASTSFGELSMTGTAGAHTWVAGAAMQRERFRPIDVPRFDYTYTIPGVFAQDDYVLTRWLTASASARLDHHNAFGTFFSPRLSILLHPGSAWTVRLSGGRGHFAPSPFTEESDATGLSVLAPMGAIKSEDANSFSTDITWRKQPLELTATLFHSSISRAQVFRPIDTGPYAARIVNAETPTRNNGGELIARVHEGEIDVIATYMYLRSTEVDERGVGRRDVPLNPRHTATFDLLWKTEVGNFGFEGYYTGRQALEDNPFRLEGRPYVILGALYSKRLGPAMLYINAEDLADVRQTKWDPLLRPSPLRDGRWAVDEWAPLEGRAVNGGLQFRF